ncbi:hypothetical protein Dimus_007968 [Dionaea muscipula]
MFPEVPIALRMSGFLLLGIVRIYSKKVEYLHRDCRLFQKQLLIAFIAPDINLLENAAQDQYEAVTLPETYQLDALELDVYPSVDGISADQVPTEREPYVAITFDDDIMPDLPQHETEADVQAHGDPVEAAEYISCPILGALLALHEELNLTSYICPFEYCVNVVDKETEPPDSSSRMRSARSK